VTSYYSGLQNAGVRIEYGLDFGGIDLEPGANDHLLQPADDIQPTVLYLATEVAGSQPTV
jgi:hypothetical protein